MSGPLDGIGAGGAQGAGAERFADGARRYRLDSRIATGGMGEVWQGTDTSLGRPVAIKLLKAEYADDPIFRSRFETEARHAASLLHPGVCSVYDVGEGPPADGSGVPRPFLVMELVEGQPLSNLLRTGRPLDPAAVRDLLVQAGDAVGAANRAGIVHRDIKPANLMVTPDRKVKITDFGIARASDGLGLTGTGQVMGTPQYLSPEQARGSQATAASDVYSLGVVGFECLVGHRPFDRESPVATALAHLNDPVPSLPDTVPAELAAVVRRALAKDAKDRYPDGASFAAALRDPDPGATTEVIAPSAAAVAAPVVAVAPAVVPPVSERTQILAGVQPAPAPSVDPAAYPAVTDRRRRNPWGIVALLAALAIAAVVIVVLLTKGNGSDNTPIPPSHHPARHTRSTSASSSPPSSASTFDINASDYIGRNVDQVAAELRQLGLRVAAQPLPNPGGHDADSVESVSPTTGLVAGDTVTVTYWQQPHPSTPPPSSTPPSSPSSPSGSSSSSSPSSSLSSSLTSSPTNSSSSSSSGGRVVGSPGGSPSGAAANRRSR